MNDKSYGKTSKFSSFNTRSYQYEELVRKGDYSAAILKAKEEGVCPELNHDHPLLNYAVTSILESADGKRKKVIEFLRQNLSKDYLKMMNKFYPILKEI